MAIVAPLAGIEHEHLDPQIDRPGSSNQMCEAKSASGNSYRSGLAGEPCFSRSKATLPPSTRMHINKYRSSSSGHSNSAPLSIAGRF